MARRLPAAPPALAGYTYVRPLGSGGFADVFLYEQSMPRRTVAVKVLLPNLSSDEVQEMFLSETMLMAQLSAHPSVLTVYEANISADGRPYLVMEHCPAAYGNRFRTETIPLVEVLQAAIAVGSVLETAHRDGVLHRDIKPANILVTRYGKPVLADFGIASTIAKSESQEAVGMSIPWSAPEVIAGTTPGSVRSEVWGFAATIYTLLAGRSPFEIPGKDNGRDEVMRRILGREALKPTGRADVPPSLERALAQAMSKDPSKRQASILEVLRALQLVETELGMRPTPLDIASESVIDVNHLVSQRPAAPTQPAEGALTRKRIRMPSGSTGGSTGSASGSAATGATVLRAWSDSKSAANKPRRTILWSSIAAIAVAVTVSAVLLVLALTQGASGIPTVRDIAANENGSSLEFSWDDPGLTDGDSYLVRVDGGPGVSQQSSTFTVDTTTSDGRVCVTVTVVRNGQNGQASEAKCAEG